MNKRTIRRLSFALVAFVAAVVSLAVGAGSAMASGNVLCGPGCGGGGPAYANPFQSSTQLTTGRTDQGVDYNGTGPIDAIGDGVVVSLDQAGSGWPGDPYGDAGWYLLYKLTDGTYAGHYVYVAESIVPKVSQGQTLLAGQEIATFGPYAAPGDYPGIETGWASSTLNVTLFSSLCGAYNDSGPTAIGDAFARFLISLGAPTEQNPGSGSLYTTSCAYTSS